MGFLSKAATAAVSSNSSQGGYLNPSKINDGQSVRFALLASIPLEFYECWGQSPDGSNKPFRFDYEPTNEDIKVELGEFVPREKMSGGIDIKFAIAVPVYNFETASVQVLSITQKGIIREFDAISQNEDYADLLAWDFTLSKKGTGINTEYKLLPGPRKKGTQVELDEAWNDAKAAGFALERLLTGGNPFKAG
jgi:hypothetical protein